MSLYLRGSMGLVLPHSLAGSRVLRAPLLMRRRAIYPARTDNVCLSVVRACRQERKSPIAQLLFYFILFFCEFEKQRVRSSRRVPSNGSRCGHLTLALVDSSFVSATDVFVKR